MSAAASPTTITSMSATSTMSTSTSAVGVSTKIEPQASGAGGGGLCAPVVDGAGPRAHRVDDAPVRRWPRRRSRLGWARRDVRGDRHRPGGVGPVGGVAADGFTELVSRVCLGEVGAIFGIEISRLARSTAEVARLMEFARLTDTLLIDADGVYDLADVNDRMLLGLKGTMGEVELHVMAGRLQGAQTGRGRARRAAHPAAGRLRPRRGRRGRHRPRRRGPGRDR